MIRQEDEKAPLLPSPQDLASLTSEERRILGEFYDLNANKQWFRGARILHKHPNTLTKTIEIIANYKPVVEMKEVISFGHKYQLSTEWIILGNL